MKKIILGFLLICSVSVTAQEIEIKKPEYVYVANNEIISKEDLYRFGEQGIIKKIDKGVSQEVRDELAKKLGNQIEEREFIVLISLLTKEEKAARSKESKQVKKAPLRKKDNRIKLSINDSAEDFSVQMTNGKEITLSDLKGKVVLINFWATWCAPCLIEFHEIPGKILQQFSADELVFIPISRGESEEKVAKKLAWLRGRGVKFDVGIDEEAKIWKDFITNPIPKNFIIDQNGIIRYISTGYREGSVDKIAAQIAELLEE